MTFRQHLRLFFRDPAADVRYGAVLSATMLALAAGYWLHQAPSMSQAERIGFGVWCAVMAWALLACLWLTWRGHREEQQRSRA